VVLKEVIEMENFEEYIKENDALFHYTSIAKGIEGILGNNSIRLYKISKMDDPREYKNWQTSLMGWSLQQEALDRWPKATIELNKRIKKSYVFCCCMNSKEKEIDEERFENEIFKYGYIRSRMWSQYGGHHRGLCFVLSKKGINKELKTLYGDTFRSSRINYNIKQNISHNALVLDGNRLTKGTVENVVENHISENYNDIFFVKNIDYRDESEYRFVIKSEHQGKEWKEFQLENTLKGIIFGEKFPKVYRPLIKQMTNSDLRRLFWINGDLFPIKID